MSQEHGSDHKPKHKEHPHKESKKGKGKSNKVDLRHDGNRRSAFTPYRPSTILTNLQRGNIQTETPVVAQELNIHQLSAQGELMAEDRTAWNLEEQDAQGLTPLMWASSYGQLPVVNLLLQWQVDVHKTGNKGENALLLASSNGHSEIIKVLLEHNVDVDHVDAKGNTALMFAAYNNHAQCALDLLKAGADVTVENIHGQTAYHIAVDNCSKQVQMILEKFLLESLKESMLLK